MSEASASSNSSDVEENIDWTTEPQNRYEDNNSEKENEDESQYVPPVLVIMLSCHLCPQTAATEEQLLEHLKKEHKIYEYICFASSSCDYSTLKL